MLFLAVDLLLQPRRHRPSPALPLHAIIRKPLSPSLDRSRICLTGRRPSRSSPSSRMLLATPSSSICPRLKPSSAWPSLHTAAGLAITSHHRRLSHHFTPCCWLGRHFTPPPVYLGKLHTGGKLQGLRRSSYFTWKDTHKDNVLGLAWNEKVRQALTPEEINEACYVNIMGNKAVFDSLRNNHKVKYDGRCFSYKSKHDLKGKDQLLSLIRKFPEGLAVVDLKDAYLSVIDDLQALKAAGQVWLLANNDSQEDIVYPNDPKVVIKVHDDLKQLFRGIELPHDMVDIEKELQKNGMKPATNTAKRRAAAQVHGIPSKSKPKKKSGINKRTKLTNAHLPELFQNLNVPDM